MSKETTLVRAPKPGEGKYLAQIRIESWREGYRGIVPDIYLEGLSLDQNAQWAEMAIARQDGMIQTAVAERQGVITGYSVTKFAQQGSPEPGQLLALYIAPALQRGGIGSVLVKHALAALCGTHEEMHVFCLEENRIGRRFYEKLGGKLLGASRPFTLPDAPDILLSEVGYRWQLV